MRFWQSQVRGVLAAATLCLLSTGCSNNNDEAEVSVSGQVQKGLFSTLNVSAQVLDPLTGSSGEPLAVVVEDQQYTVQVPVDSLLLIEATGQFTSEFDASPVSLDEPLQAVLQVETSDLEANVNLATTLSSALTLAALADSGQDPGALIEQHDQLVVQQLGLPGGTDPSALSISAIPTTATLDDPNLQLLLYSTAVVAALDEASLFAGGFGEIVAAFADPQVPGLADLRAPLNGVSAAGLYNAARIASGLDLPELPGLADQILACDENGCVWDFQPTPTVALGTRISYEAYGKARLDVNLGQTPTEPVVVTITSSDGTASANEDYLAINQTLEIPAGQVVARLDVPLLIDALAEGNETISLGLAVATAGWSALRERATITIKDGAPAGFRTRDTTGIEIASLCARQFGAADSLDADQCDLDPAAAIGLATGATEAALVEIDLTLNCADPNSCLPGSRDRLVDFFLVAEDSLGMDRAELALGPYVYPERSLQQPAEPVALESPLISLAETDLVSFAANALDAGWSMRLEARLAGDPGATQSDPLPGLLPLPATLELGGETLTLGEVAAVDSSGGSSCSTGAVAIDARYILDPELPDEFNELAPSGILCVELTYENGTATGVVVDGQLGLKGSLLSLPEGLVNLPQVGTPVYFSGLGGFPRVLGIPDDPGNISLLFAEGWPFAFAITDGTLDADGITLSYSDVQYLMQVDYSAQDPRANGERFSNDAIYAGVAGRSGTLQLGPDGISGTLNIASGTGKGAFPRADITWDAVSQELINNELQPVAGITLEYALSQSSACRFQDCDADQTLSYRVRGSNAKLDGRGFTVAAATTLAPVVPAWGAFSGGGWAYTRPDDLPVNAPVNIALPGYRIPGDALPHQFIQAHLQDPGADQNLTLHPSGSPAYIDGNYLPVGLSVGPRVYRDPTTGRPVVDGAQDLTGEPLVINNRNEVISLASSIGSKYVIRNAGVTGVFNATTAALSTAINYSGYPLDLERFGIRLTDNELDSFNWVDGSLTLNGDLGGPDGETFYFTNLELNCAARLGNSTLAFESCDAKDNDEDGVIDENCDVRLASWRADAELYAAGFTGAASCAADTQTFVLNHDLDFRALNRRLPFESLWQPDGSLAGSAAKDLPALRVDVRESVAQSGFSIQPSALRLDVADVSGARDGRYGWLNLEQAVVAVPFWNGLNADLRVANDLAAGLSVSEETVLAPAGLLASLPSSRVNQTNQDLQESLITDGPDLSAVYQWGSTGFGFDLPVYYQPWQLDPGFAGDDDILGQQSRFIGRMEERDLFVLETSHGINFIEPRRTKLSFGASANIEALTGSSFSIDITDPRSLEKVDAFLIDLGVSRRPVLAPALNEIQGAVIDVNELGNRGLEDLMRRGLEASLEALGESAAGLTPDGQDPFVTVSDALARIKVYPQQVRSVLEEELKRPIDAISQEVESSLRSSLIEARASIVAAADVQGIAEARTAVIARRAQVQQLERQVIEIFNATGQRLDDVRSLVDAVEAPAAELIDALDSIELILDQSVSFSTSVCNTGLQSGAENDGYLAQVILRFSSVRRLFQLTEDVDVLLPIVDLLADDPELARRLRDGERRVRNRAEELVLFLEAAENAVRDQVCSEDIANVLTSALELIDTLRSESQTITGGLTAVYSELDRFEESLLPVLETAREPLQLVDQTLGFVQSQLERGIGGETLASDADQFLAALTENTPFRISLLVDETGDPNLNDLADVFGELVSDGVDVPIDALFTFLDIDVLNQLPGAYFSPEELRRQLVGRIMASGPVGDLRTLMNVHFEEVQHQVNTLLLGLFDQINLGLRGLVAGVESQVNSLLDQASAPVRGLPLESVSADGYAVINGNELDRAHLGAEWVLASSADDQEATRFGAALDVIRWGAVNGPSGCSAPGGDSRVDVTISAYGMPLEIVGSGITIEQLMFGFTLIPDGALFPFQPAAVYGGIYTLGSIGFGEASVNDPGFAAGVGDVQNYLGASAEAVFSGLQADVAFLVGRVCPPNEVLRKLDRDVAKFITIPDSGFAGVYLRGGVSIPIIPGGCFLKVGIRSDFGAWLLAGGVPEFGGLVGGGAYGEVACIASLRGQVKAILEGSRKGGFRFVGEGFGAAGLGFCEPETWTSRRRSRQDDWCGTGDALFEVEFDGEWQISPPEVDAVF